MTEIKQNDITFVVAGPVHEGGIENSHNKIAFRYSTKEALQSIRKHYPEAKILLSTWEGSNTKGLEFDQLVLSEDPGKEPFDWHNAKVRYQNVARMATTALHGLQNVQTKYSIKTRTDAICTSNNLLIKYASLLKQMPLSPNKELKIFKQKILLDSLITLSMQPFHISDVVHFGLNEDLIKLWQPLYDFLYKIIMPFKDEPLKTVIPKHKAWEDYIKPYAQNHYIMPKNIKVLMGSGIYAEQLLGILAMQKVIDITNLPLADAMYINSEENYINYYKILINNFVIANTDLKTRLASTVPKGLLLNSQQLYKRYNALRNNAPIKAPLVKPNLLYVVNHKAQAKYKELSLIFKLIKLMYSIRIAIGIYKAPCEYFFAIKIRVGYKLIFLPIGTIYMIHKIYRNMPKFIKQWHINKIKKALDEEYNNLPSEVTISNDK